MIKILNITQIRNADAATINDDMITSLDLMDRAGNACFKELSKLFPSKEQHFIVFAGSGNNGGDGLVIARKLLENNYNVDVYFVKFSSISSDCNQNLTALQGLINVKTIESISDFFEIDENNVIIDSLLGSGISRQIEGLVLDVINMINSTSCKVVSIDLPSGLFADKSSLEFANKIIKANYTLTIGVPKLALLLPENEHFCGEWHFVDIELSSKFLDKSETKYFFTELQDLVPFLTPRPIFSHKGLFGHALILAGSIGKSGASVLATNACLRSGCGLTTVHCAKKSLNILQIKAPEAMCSVDEDDNYISQIPDLNQYTAYAFGMGCQKYKKTTNALKLLIQNATKPLLIDADGLNILAENKTWLSFLPKNTILTPHIGEFKRIFGDSKNDFERLDLALEMAAKFNCIIVLKGAYTAVITQFNQVFFNPTGNSGMAKGGSGDVLSGIIVGLLARGISPQKASVLGVFLHGLAGDIAAQQFGSEAMKAGDIIDALPVAWKEIIR